MFGDAVYPNEPPADEPIEVDSLVDWAKEHRMARGEIFASGIGAHFSARKLNSDTTTVLRPGLSRAEGAQFARDCHRKVVVLSDKPMTQHRGECIIVRDRIESKMLIRQCGKMCLEVCLVSLFTTAMKASPLLHRPSRESGRWSPCIFSKLSISQYKKFLAMESNSIILFAKTLVKNS